VGSQLRYTRTLRAIVAITAIVSTMDVLAAQQSSASPTATASARDGHGQPAPPTEKRKDPVPVVRVGDVLSFEFKAKFQGDLHRSYEGANIQADLGAFEMPRQRVGVQGTLLTHLEFEVERDFATRTLTAEEIADHLWQQTAWTDVYVNATYLKRAQLQVGRFKIPFGRDELTSIAENDFVYRSLGAVYLAPGRDTGVVVHGRLFSRGLSYASGVFLHDGDHARSKRIQGGDGTAAVRVTGTPLRSIAAFKGLELGTAFTAGDVSADSFRPNGLRNRTVMTEDYFFDSVYVNGRRHRWEGDLEWVAGPASLRAEYTYVTDDRLAQGLEGEDLPDARYRSWYVSGGCVLTGERKTRPIRPRTSFLKGGIGAIELAARYEETAEDSVDRTGTPSRSPRAATILPSGNHVLTLGVNWILNRWITVQTNVIREHVQDAARNPVPGGAPFWSQVLRFQFVL